MHGFRRISFFTGASESVVAFIKQTSKYRTTQRTGAWKALAHQCANSATHLIW